MHKRNSFYRGIAPAFFLLIALSLALVGCDDAEFSVSDQHYTRTAEQSFSVGDAPALELDNFGGAISVRAGESGTIRVVMTSRAAEEQDLDRIQVSFDERESGLYIETERPRQLHNVSANFEIIAPADARLNLHTGGGSIAVDGFEDQVVVNTHGGGIEIRHVSGDVDAHTNGGNIDLRDVSGDVNARTNGGGIDISDASGQVDAHTNGGGIDYRGAPQGECQLRTNAGSIDIRIPTDANLSVELQTHAGKVRTGFAVSGHISKSTLDGTIGNGDGGHLYAVTHAGDIDLEAQ